MRATHCRSSDPRGLVCAFACTIDAVRRCRSSTDPSTELRRLLGPRPPSRHACHRTYLLACLPLYETSILIAAPALRHDGVGRPGSGVSRIRRHRHRGCRHRGTQHPGAWATRSPSCCCSRSCRPYRLCTWMPSALVGAPTLCCATRLPHIYQRAVTVAFVAGVACWRQPTGSGRAASGADRALATARAAPYRSPALRNRNAPAKCSPESVASRRRDHDGGWRDGQQFARDPGDLVQGDGCRVGVCPRTTVRCVAQAHSSCETSERPSGQGELVYGEPLDSPVLSPDRPSPWTRSPGRRRIAASRHPRSCLSLRGTRRLSGSTSPGAYGSVAAGLRYVRARAVAMPGQPASRRDPSRWLAASRATPANKATVTARW